MQPRIIQLLAINWVTWYASNQSLYGSSKYGLHSFSVLLAYNRSPSNSPTLPLVTFEIVAMRRIF